MAWDRDLTLISNELARLYSKEDESVRIVEQSGLRKEYMRFSDKAVENWHNILSEASRRPEWLEGLITHSINDSRSAELEKFYKHYLDKVRERSLSVENSRASAAKVGEGLTALVALLRVSEVQHTLVIYRVDLDRASKQIDVMADYKDVHDLLHELQVYCLDQVQQIIRRFGVDQITWSDMETHLLTFQRVMADLRDVAGRATFSINSGGREIQQIQDRLNESLAMLQLATGTSDVKKIDNATLLLSRVLSIEPPLINLQIKEAANHLNLAALAKAMSEVRESITKANLDMTEARQFVAGVDALIELKRSLEALVGEHDMWQVVDRDLRGIGPNPERQSEIDLLELMWPKLKDSAELLYQHSTDVWAENFRKYGEKLEGALKKHDTNAILCAFGLYRRQAVDRFFTVDKALKRLCEQLRRIGAGPLEAVKRAVDMGSGDTDD